MGASPRKRLDWTAIRTEYVTGSTPLRELADKHGVSHGMMMRRAAKEKWADARSAAASKVQQKVEESAVQRRARELSAWNEDDLKIAKAIRGRVAQALAALASEKGLKALTVTNLLRTLAGTAESAQKIARLAMGATTDNTGISDPEGNPLPTMTLAEYYSMVQFVSAADDESADSAGGIPAVSH